MTNYDFNFEWYSRNFDRFAVLTGEDKKTLNYINLTSFNLASRIVGKSFKLIFEGNDVAFFQIKEIVSVGSKGTNIILNMGNKKAIILSFIDITETEKAVKKIEVALNGGAI